MNECMYVCIYLIKIWIPESSSFAGMVPLSDAEVKSNSEGLELRNGNRTIIWKYKGTGHIYLFNLFN